MKSYWYIFNNPAFGNWYNTGSSSEITPIKTGTICSAKPSFKASYGQGTWCPYCYMNKFYMWLGYTTIKGKLTLDKCDKHGKMPVDCPDFIKLCEKTNKEIG